MYYTIYFQEQLEEALLSLNDAKVRQCLDQEQCVQQLQVKIIFFLKTIAGHLIFTNTIIFKSRQINSWYNKECSIKCITKYRFYMVIFQGPCLILHEILALLDTGDIIKAPGRRVIIYMLRNSGLDVNTQDKVSESK